jgi:hypothetical protein
VRPSGQTAPTPIPDDDCSGLTQAPRRPAAVACDQSDRKRSRQLTHTLHVLCVGATTSFGLPVFAEVTHREPARAAGECQSSTLNAPERADSVLQMQVQSPGNANPLL